MTGNNKVWRASLAGLASFAMLATMGVAAGTANAAVAQEDAPQYTVTFKVNGKEATSRKLTDGAIKVTAGDSLADALGGYSTGVSFASYDGGARFAGWLNGSSYYDFNAPVTGDLTLNADIAESTKDTVKIQFTDTTGLQFPDDSHSGVYYVRQGVALADQRKPVDKADGSVWQSWDVEQEDGSVKNQSDLTIDNVFEPEADNTITVTPKDGTNDVAQLKVEGSDQGYVLGARSDGNKDGESADKYIYAKDVVKVGDVTVPAWVSTKINPVKTPAGVKLNSNAKDTHKFGDTFALSESKTYVPSDETTQTVTVTFQDGKGNVVTGGTATVTFESGEEYGYLSKDYTVPAVPSIDNFVAKGWKLQSGMIDNASDFADTDGLGFHAYTAADFATARIASDLVFVPAQGGKTTEITVTFKDTDYRDNNESKTVKVKGGYYLSSSEAPAWTRDGYVLAFWTKDATATSSSAKYEFDKTQITNDTKNFTLYPVWVKTDGSVLEAALQYINPDKAEVEGGYADYFTADSWKAYKAVYTKVKQDKAVEEYYASSKISDEDAARLVSELKAGWESLKFDTEGTPTLDPTADSDANPFVYRLHKDGLRLYSQTLTEVYAAQRTGWTLDNGYLFRTTPKAAAQNEDFKALASFDAAAEFAGAGKPQEYKDDLAAQLDKLADPIVNSIERFQYGTDWLYVSSTSAKEISSLKKGGWNHEGTAFVVPAFGGNTTVVRFAKGGQHLLSTGATEQASLERNGWTREGVAFRAY